VIFNRYSKHIRSLLLDSGGDTFGAEAARNTGGSFVTKVSGLGISFLSQLVLARLLGVEDFGYYIYVWTWILVLSIFASLSYDLVAIRFVKDYKARQEWGFLRAFLKHAFHATLIFSLIMIVLTLCAINVLHQYALIEQRVANLFYIALLLLPISAGIKVQTGILRGTGQVVLAMALDALLYPILICFGVGMCAVFGPAPVTASAALISTIAAAIVIFIIQRLYIHRDLSLSLKILKPQFCSRQWLGAATSITMATLFQQLMRQIDILIVGNVAGKTEAGIYSVAARMAGLVPLGLEIANYGSAHLFGHLHVQGLKDVLQRVVFFTARVTFLLTIPAVIVLFFLGDPLMGLFGKGFVGGMLILRILILGQLANALTGPNNLLMNMTGHHNEMALIAGSVFAADVVLMWLLVPLWGAVGAAAATSFTLALRNSIVVLRVWQHLGINSTIFSRKVWATRFTQ
jgi:O-antigen/teichoic acid export membrane protein